MVKRIAFVVGFALAVSGLCLAQQDKSKRPSPPAQAQCRFADGKTITVDYSSPRMKGRKIFGELVPYGEVWRTGANEATTFVSNANLTVEGKDVPAGSYTIFSLPAQENWTLIVSKHTGEWGIPYKYESEELARVPMKVSPTQGAVENFTISFDQSGGACTMQLSWENTQAAVSFAEKR